MARRNAAKPGGFKAKGSAAPSARPKLKPSGGGASMLKKLMVLVVLGGVGYAAVKVPIQGRTAFRRAVDAIPYEVVRKAPARAVASNDAARRKASTPLKAPAERISQADRDALDKLLPH